MIETHADSRVGPGAADVGHVALRLVVGGLLAGHGAQKLFGWFGGDGLNGTSAWLTDLGYHPATPWAVLLGVSEFGGGVLTALGLLHPFGAIATLGSATIATPDVHRGHPIWAAEGGAELRIINVAAGAASALAGPAAFSLDRAISSQVPRRLIAESQPKPITSLAEEAQDSVPASELRLASCLPKGGERGEGRNRAPSPPGCRGHATTSRPYSLSA